MKYRFSISNRTTSDNALIAYIDLLGTSDYWISHDNVEDHAERTFNTLLCSFDTIYSEMNPDCSCGSYDISIFADSICISERITTPNAINKLVSFCLKFQIDLLINCNILSRISILRDSFYSLKLDDASPNSVLGSKYTSVSLCGGKGIIRAHNIQERLPMGVYLDAILMKELNEPYNKLLIPVINNNSIFFVMNENKDNATILNIAADLIVHINNILSSRNTFAIKSKFIAFDNPNALNKFLPWLLVHLGYINHID